MRYGRNSGPLWLRMSAIMVPIICMAHAVAKLVFFTFVDDGHKSQ